MGNPADLEMPPVLADMSARGARRVRRRIRQYRRQPGRKQAHRLSIAFTRYLAVDRLCRLCLGKRLIRPGKTGLRRVRKVLGRMRDAQELEAKARRACEDSGQRNPRLAPYMSALRVEQSEAARKLARHLRALPHGLFSKQHHGRALRLKLEAASPEPLDRVRTRLLRRVLAMRPAALGPDEDDHALHRMRVRFKAYRYVLEMLPPAYTGADPAFLKELKACQDAMGEAHDWLVLRQSWMRLADPPAPMPAWIEEHYRRSHRKARERMRRTLINLEAKEFSGTG